MKPISALGALVVIAAASAACHGDRTGPSTDSDRIPVYSASTTVAATTITVQASATNPGPRTVQVTLRAPCTIVLQVFADESRGGNPVWDQEVWSFGCKSFAWPVTLRPGETKDWTTEIPISEIMAGNFRDDRVEPLPPGRYYFSVLIRQFAPTEDRILIPAGDADLP